MRTLLLLLALSAVSTGYAQDAAVGYLHLRLHSEMEHRPGARAAELFVYDDSGSIVHSGATGGQFPAGDFVPVPPGWYFVEVGHYRSIGNVARVRVDAGKVTVVPSGWVSVSTPPLDELPMLGCQQWNAELSAFASGPDGREALIATNRGSGVATWGAIQLGAGERLIYFNELPARFEVRADELNELPTGFQDPMFGQRGQLATGPETAADVRRIPLCEDGALQVPTGVYHASAVVPTNVHPFERREWTEVVVTPHDALQHQRLDVSRLPHPRFDGEGSTPMPPDEAEIRRLSGGEPSSGRIRLDGFGR